MVEKTCLKCGKKFLTENYRINKAKFCSYKCSNNFNINTWNKGIKIDRKKYPKLGHLIPHTIAGKKNISTSLKGKMVGNNHWEWKGEKVGYRALHSWVERMLGKATKCEFCKKEWDKPRSIGWANKNHKYNRNLIDWISLCQKCHGRYDRELRLRRNKSLLFH